MSRKLSDFTEEDVNELLTALTSFQENLDERDGQLSSDLLPALENIVNKLKVAPYSAFSEVDDVMFSELNIPIRPLSLLTPKCADIEAYGLAETEGNWLDINATRKFLHLIRGHVSMANEAGSRMLINVFLLRLASVMCNEGQDINIIPEFPIPWTPFHGHAFGGVVDFLVTKVPPDFTELLLGNPGVALAPHNLPPSSMSNIFQAKNGNVSATLPQAIVAAAAYCKQHSLSVLRGCVTSGERWAFFVCKSDESHQVEVAVAGQIALGQDLEGLALILGILRDWVENSNVFEQKFFAYQEL